MLSLISLSVKCVHCGNSLMDAEHRLDNEPSFALRMWLDGREGCDNPGHNTIYC